MSDCPRDGLDGCHNCWGQIFAHLASERGQETPILPRPEFCQDAAFTAWCLDGRLKTIHELQDLLTQARGGLMPGETVIWGDDIKGQPVRHNHLTRDIKPPGQCPGCDVHRGQEPPDPRLASGDAHDPYRR